MAFTYSRTITIDHTKCGSTTDTSNFPVLISGTYSYLATTPTGNIQNTVTSNGITIPADLGFYSDAGLTTKLAWEVAAYTASSGLIEAWVKLPTLSHSSDTLGNNTFYMAYGDSSVTTDQSNMTGTWNDGGSNYYKGVYHLEDNTTGTVVKDSSPNAKNLTYHNTNTSNASATAQIGRGFNIAQTSANRADTSDSSFIAAGDFTLECWVKPASSPTNVYQALIVNGDGGGANRNYGMFLSGAGTSKMYLVINNTTQADNSITWTAGAWNHIIFTQHNGGNAVVYMNSTNVFSTASGQNTGTTASYNTYVGGENASYPVTNLLDECRISLGIARSADYVKACYNNQNAPDKATFGSSGFYTIGSAVTHQPAVGGTLGLMGVG